jgi:hypothetical protein
MIFRAIASIIIVAALSLFVVPSASAHNTQPRVEISIERLHPGEVVDIRGVSFGMDDSVTLALIGTGFELSLGELIASPEGEFAYIAMLPTDLVEGTYYFRATTLHHWVLSPPLTVWGTAIMEGGGQGPRDDDDGLLAPMPTFPPAAATTSVPVVSVPVETPSVSSGVGTNILILAALMVVVAAVLMRLGRKRSE